MNFEQKKESGPEGPGRAKEIANGIRGRFLETIGGKTFTVFGSRDSRKDIKVTATGNIDQQGYPYIREPDADHSTITAPENILHAPEAKSDLQELIAAQNLSEAEADEVRKELGI